VLVEPEKTANLKISKGIVRKTVEILEFDYQKIKSKVQIEQFQIFHHLHFE